MITLKGLFLFLSIFLVGYAFWRHLGIGQRALLAAKSYTKQNGVSLLDQSVHLKKIRIELGRKALFSLTRTYEFEFSTRGDKRYLGWIVMIGIRVRSIDLQPFVEELTEVH